MELQTFESGDVVEQLTGDSVFRAWEAVGVVDHVANNICYFKYSDWERQEEFERSAGEKLNCFIISFEDKGETVPNRNFRNGGWLIA